MTQGNPGNELAVATIDPNRAEEPSRVRLLLRTSMELVAGNERRRFMTGSVVVPLAIAAATLWFGAVLTANYQDWQDRRSRARDIVDGIRTATAELGSNLEVLAQRGGTVERLRSEHTVIEQVHAVDATLLSLGGMVSALNSDQELSSYINGPIELESAIARCKEKVTTYVSCLVSSLKRPLEDSRDDKPCTTSFRHDLSADGSCDSLRASSYAIHF